MALGTVWTMLAKRARLSFSLHLGDRPYVVLQYIALLMSS